MTYEPYIVAVFLMFAIAELIHSQLLSKDKEVKDDIFVEVIGTTSLFVVTQPFILFTSAAIAAWWFPQFQGSLSSASIWLMLLLFMVFDDMMQYWWHRLSHSYIPLYKLHRAHHNAKYMSVRIVYRNNFFYYLLMPSLWFSGVLIYLGLGWFYAFYLVAKLSIIMGAHCDWKWDAALYKIKWMQPVMWILERLISTPSTHSGHHGLHKSDPATHYKGNYGNMFFIWDILFGTAKITRQYPTAYGVEGMKKANWKEQLFWPVYKTNKTSK